MAVQFSNVVLYARDIEATVLFYEKHFGFSALRRTDDRIIELVNEDGGASIMVYQAGKAQKQGQSVVKLAFAVEDVRHFCEVSAGRGLEFGPLHQADGYVYANARDPSGNPISVSSRRFRKST